MQVLEVTIQLATLIASLFVLLVVFRSDTRQESAETTVMIDRTLFLDDKDVSGDPVMTVVRDLFVT